LCAPTVPDTLARDSGALATGTVRHGLADPVSPPPFKIRHAGALDALPGLALTDPSTGRTPVS